MSIELRTLALALALTGFVGCIPYREVWRPEVAGIVVDARGQPQAGVVVHACSVSRWWGFSQGCAVSSDVMTGDGGAFSFDVARRWDSVWCICPGEAPLPETLIYVCTPNGAAAAYDDGARLTLRPALEPAPSIGADQRVFLANQCSESPIVRGITDGGARE